MRIIQQLAENSGGVAAAPEVTPAIDAVNIDVGENVDPVQRQQWFNILTAWFFSKLSPFFTMLTTWFCSKISALFSKFIAWICSKISAISASFTKMFAWVCAHFFRFNTWVKAKVYKGDKNTILFTGKEIATIAPNVFAYIFTLTAIKYPGETDSEQHTRGYFLVGLTILYVLAYYVRVLMDYTDDHAVFLFYKASTRAGESVYYHKTIRHVFGMIVIVMSTMVCYYTLFYKEPQTVYNMSIVTGVFSVFHALLQSYKSDTSPAIVDEEEKKVGFPVQACSKIPPRGRFVFYERVPDAEPVPVE